MNGLIIILIYIFLMLCDVTSGKNYLRYPISKVDIKNVKINDNFWFPKIKKIQEITIPYAFEKCEKEGRMDNFLVAGGVKKGKYRGKMPFDDTDLYKIIEGASYSLITLPDAKLEAYLDSVIDIIKVGQESDGYITTWFTIDRKNPPAWWVKPSKKRWENLVSSHELYNSGHLFHAAVAHYLSTGKRNFLDIAIKNADLLVKNFGQDKLSVPPGHQIVESGLIRLYEVTGNRNYLELAKFFLDIRGDSTTHKLYGEYSQDHKPVTRQTEAVGHAVRAVYMYAAMTDIAAIFEDTAYLNAVSRLWENVVNKKMYITGGIGSRHEGEAFGKNYELPNLTAYCETCASIGNVLWNHKMFLLFGDSKYYDIIERTLYNGIISGISIDGTKFFYPNPLESDGKYAFNQGTCTRKPWFDCSCCPTNLIRFIPYIPGLIYANDKNSIYVNLFISSKAEILIGDTKVIVEQETDYPWDGHIRIFVNPEKSKKFSLKLRIPGWTQGRPVPGDLYCYKDAEKVKIILKINKKKKKLKINNKGYAEIIKRWKKGDKVELIFPMKVRMVIANKNVIEDRNKVAFEYGPFVYCAEEVDNKNISDITIPNNIEFNIKGMKILSEKVLAIESTFNNESLILIPYYVWSNRGIGKMKVWFPIVN